MISAIILAAGQAKRFGSPKQLLDYQGQPLITHIVKTVLDSYVNEVIVVVGANAKDVCAALFGLQVTIVHNNDYTLGQSTSLKAGIQALRNFENLDGFLITLGDLPLLQTKTIDSLIDIFNNKGGIIIPTYKNTPGHPVIFARSYINELEQITGDVGARQIIKRHMSVVTHIEVADKGVIMDIDTWEDYEKMI